MRNKKSRSNSCQLQNQRREFKILNLNLLPPKVQVGSELSSRSTVLFTYAKRRFSGLIHMQREEIVKSVHIYNEEDLKPRLCLSSVAGKNP